MHLLRKNVKRRLYNFWMLSNGPLLRSRRRAFHRIKSPSLANRPFFRTYPPAISPSIVNSKAVVDPDHKYIYFRIPKSANTTISATLLSAKGSQLQSNDTLIKFKTLTPRLSSLSEIDLIDNLSSYFKFAVVRHPISRFYSCYLDKVYRDCSQRKTILCGLKRPKESELSIDSFLDYLEYYGGLYDNAHWSLQCNLIPVPIKHINYIGKVENIDHDMREICRRIFSRETDVSTHSPHSTKSVNRLNELTKGQKERVSQNIPTGF